MLRPVRWPRRSRQPHLRITQPQSIGHVLVSAGFRLVMFGMIACYVEVLQADGHSLVAAVAAAVSIAASVLSDRVVDSVVRFAPRLG